jgi:hypothetical protein
VTDLPLTLGEALTILSILSGFGLAIWRMGRFFSRLEIRQVAFENRLIDLEKDRYPLSVASEAALRLAILNPGMQVPDPRTPTQVIVVHQARVVERPGQASP